MMMKFIFNAFVDLKPVERFENGSDEDLGALTARASRVLDLLEPVKLTVWKVVTETVTTVKFRMDNGGCNGAGCSEVCVHLHGLSRLSFMYWFRPNNRVDCYWIFL